MTDFMETYSAKELDVLVERYVLGLIEETMPASTATVALVKELVRRSYIAERCLDNERRRYI